MSDFDEGQDPTAEISSEAENSQEVDTGQQTQSEGGINPVWEPIRNELGLQFESIKPHLLDIDKGFNDGITKANAKYAPWKDFDEKGITPDKINESFTVLQRLNDNPEEVYAALGQFLQENGRLPKNAQEAEQALDDADEDESNDPRIAELQQQLEDLQNFQQAQQQQIQMEQLNAKAEQEVSREYSTFEAAHPELSEQDRQWIYQQHYMYAASGPQNIKSLEDVYKEFSGLTDRIRSTPRPNDLAPRLPGAGGGVPTGQSKRPEEFSREESQNAMVQALLSAQGK